MKKIIRLSENELIKLIKKIINEGEDPSNPEMPEIPPEEYLDLIASDGEKNMDNDIVQPISEYWFNRRMLRSNKIGQEIDSTIS